jgi:hypothetical protein
MPQAFPAEPPPQGQDINYRTGQLGNKNARLGMLLYVLPWGDVAQGCVRTDVGKCLVTLGASTLCFLNMAARDTLSQGLPVRPLGKR